MRSGFRDECGVFGVFDAEDAARLAYLGLYALQHRGQESAGIATLDAAGNVLVEREMGYVADVFDEARLARLPGRTAIGHVRYATAGRIASRQRSAPRLRDGPRTARRSPTTGTSSTRGRSGRRSRRRARSSRRRRTPRSSSISSRARARRRSRARSPTRSPTCAAPFRSIILSREGIFAVRDPNGIRPLVARAARRGPGRRLGDLRLRPDRREIRAGRRAGRDRAPVVRRLHLAPLRVPAPDALHLRARVLRAAGLDGVRQERRGGSRGLRREAGARASGPGGRRRARARLRHVRRARLRARERHPVRPRPRAQSLRRTHVHRAEADDPQLRRHA